MNDNSEALYRKVGRKYVPYGNCKDWGNDILEVGKFRLVFASGDGAKRYRHDVTPDTAGFYAAMMLAKTAMEDAMNKAAVSSHQSGKVMTYTKKQLKIIEDFRKNMAEAGGLMPSWWSVSSAREIADAGLEAVLNYPLLKK